MSRYIAQAVHTEGRIHETESDGCTALPGERYHVIVYLACRRLLGNAGGRLQARGGDALGLIRDHGAGGVSDGAARQETAGHLRLRQWTLRQCCHAHRGNGGQHQGVRLGGYPDIDALFKQQDAETDRAKREALLHQIQQLMHERVMFAPIWLYIWPSGIGPRVEDPALMSINPYPWSAPLEDVRLKQG